MAASSRNGSARASFRAGFADMLQAGPGVFAWGLVTGVAMGISGLGTMASVVISLVVYAGSAQLATLPLIVGGAAWWLIVLTALVVNLRFTVYSATLAPLFATAPAWHRLLLGYCNGDITFVRLLTHLQQRPQEAHRYAFYWGLVAANWLTWQAGSLLGIFAAGSIPMSWGVGTAGTLTLAAVLAPSLRSRPMLIGALVSASVAVAARDLPMRLGIVAGLVAGIAAAMVAAARRAPDIAAVRSS